MKVGPDISYVASLIGDPARANMLFALKLDGRISAGELSVVAGVAPSTASEHLAKLAEAGLAPWVAGAVITALAAGGLVGCLLTGILVRRAGHARVFTTLAATVILSTLLIAVGTEPELWVLSRAIYGFASAGLFIVTRAIRRGAVPPRRSCRSGQDGRQALPLLRDVTPWFRLQRAGLLCLSQGRYRGAANRAGAVSAGQTHLHGADPPG